MIEPLLRNPIPGKKFVEPVLRGSRDPAENVGEPGLRIDVVELGSADEGIHGCGTPAAGVGAGEQPGASAQGNTSERPVSVSDASEAPGFQFDGKRGEGKRYPVGTALMSFVEPEDGWRHRTPCTVRFSTDVRISVEVRLGTLLNKLWRLPLVFIVGDAEGALEAPRLAGNAAPEARAKFAAMTPGGAR